MACTIDHRLNLSSVSRSLHLDTANTLIMNGSGRRAWSYSRDLVEPYQLRSTRRIRLLTDVEECLVRVAGALGTTPEASLRALAVTLGAG